MPSLALSPSHRGLPVGSACFVCRFGNQSKNFFGLLLSMGLWLLPLKPIAQNHPATLQSLPIGGGVTIDLIKVYPGTFLMGQRTGEQDAYPNKETPQHAVSLTHGFWMGQCEITKEQWKKVMGTEPWRAKPYVLEDGKSPAVYISWNDATQFADRLSRQTGKHFRLPTEAEWEYACRAGTTTRFYWGNDPNYTEIDKMGWWRGNSLVKEEKYAHRAGQFPPNPWGFYDLAGNVSEWCSDWHSYYPVGASTDPRGPESAEHRVLRGGSWISIGGHCRSSRRHHELPQMAHSDFGLRIVLEDDPSAFAGKPVTTNLFTAGAEGVNTYRIPSLILAPDNSLLAFCEARKESIDDASPTDMILRRSLDGGKTWLPTQILIRGKEKEALMNPCPVVDRTNHRILLFCIDANRYGANLHRQLLLTSDDNGVSWSQPIEAGKIISHYNNSFVSGPGIGIQMKQGRLVIPGYIGSVDDELDENFSACALYSDDHGKSWTMGKAVDQLSDESQVIELADGTLMLNMRGNMGMSCRGVATSRDGGASWSTVQWDHHLNECPCQASIIRYSPAGTENRNRILFANPDNTGERFGILDRSGLTVRMSYDEGKSWPVKKLIHAGPASYSTMVRLPNGEIGLLFEGGEKQRREWIRFVTFSLEWLTNGMD